MEWRWRLQSQLLFPRGGLVPAHFLWGNRKWAALCGETREGLFLSHSLFRSLLIRRSNLCFHVCLSGFYRALYIAVRSPCISLPPRHNLTAGMLYTDTVKLLNYFINWYFINPSHNTTKYISLHELSMRNTLFLLCLC